jgi:putative FmdB family regulatory protein
MLEENLTMPLYEYQCMTCGEIEEAIQKFSDPPLTTCRRCSGKLSKLISQSSFHLKGTGWYVTDYSRKTSSSAAAKDSPSKTADGEKKKSIKADTKAAKTEA